MANDAFPRENLIWHNMRIWVMQVTAAQAMKAVEIGQRLSNLYRDIYLFRFDPLTGDIYILAGEALSVSISQDANVEIYA
jgi:hypothetical protein